MFNSTTVISFPKCGRTWLKVVVGKYLELKYQKTTDFLDFDELTNNNLKFTHDGSDWTKDKPAAPEDFAETRVIMLTRNPYDAFVSYYNHVMHRDKIYDGNISSLITSKLDPIGNYKRLYKRWEDNKYVPKDYAIISYEDMHTDPVKTIGKVIRILTGSIDITVLEEAIEFGKFDNMKKLEQSRSISKTSLAYKGNARAMKVRSGKVNGYKEHLSEHDIRMINKVLESNESPNNIC